MLEPQRQFRRIARSRSPRQARARRRSRRSSNHRQSTHPRKRSPHPCSALPHPHRAATEVHAHLQIVPPPPARSTGRCSLHTTSRTASSRRSLFPATSISPAALRVVSWRRLSRRRGTGHSMSEPDCRGLLSSGSWHRMVASFAVTGRLARRKARVRLHLDLDSVIPARSQRSSRSKTTRPWHRDARDFHPQGLLSPLAPDPMRGLELRRRSSYTPPDPSQEEHKPPTTRESTINRTPR